jgi:hypothetical protein
MVHALFIKSLTGTPCRAAKRQRSKYSWWMHLGAAKIGTRQKIQCCWAQHTFAMTNSLFLAWYALIIHSVFIGPTPAPMQQKFTSCSARLLFMPIMLRCGAH